MDKAPDAYRTISEVGEDLDIAQHVLRFWETRFPQIKPLKRGGGRRYYRPDDVELLKGIRHLLYKEGYTIKGVQRILKEQGPRAVQAFARPLEPDMGHEPEPTGGDGYPAAPIVPAVAPPRAPAAVPPVVSLREQPRFEENPQRAGLNAAGPLFSAGSVEAPQEPARIETPLLYPEARTSLPSGLAEPSAPGKEAAAGHGSAPGHVSMFRGGVQAPTAARDDQTAGPSPEIPLAPIAKSASETNASDANEGLLLALRELEACRQIISAALARRIG